MKTEVQPLIPALRFPKFEGEWVLKKLEDVCVMKAGKFISAAEIEDEFKDGLNPCYGGNGLRGYVHSYTNSGRFSLIGRQGAYCGNITLSDGIFHATEHAVVVTPEKNIVTDWLYFALVLLRLNQYSTGQAQPGLSVSTIKKVKLHYPPSLPEQQKIASFLTTIDNRIQALEKKKNSLEQYKKGVMQKIFTQEIRFKDEDGKDFPEWEEKKLGEVCKFFSGGTPKSTNKRFYSGDIPFIGSGNISDSMVNSFITNEALNNSSAKLIECGDLLYALYGATSGEVAISKLTGAINQAVLCIRTKENKNYLFQLLKFNQEKIVKTFIQGGQGNLSAKIIKELKFSLPSIPEQTHIANFLTALDKKIALVNEQIEKTKAYKKGLLQKMFV